MKGFLWLGFWTPFRYWRVRGTPKRQDDFLSLSLLRLEDVSQGWKLLASIALTAEAVCAVRRNWLLPPPPLPVLPLPPPPSPPPTTPPPLSPPPTPSVLPLYQQQLRRPAAVKRGPPKSNQVLQTTTCPPSFGSRSTCPCFCQDPVPSPMHPNLTNGPTTQ